MVITLFLILKTGTQNWTPYMLYEAKQGTKAYKYIKSILDAEFE